MPPTTTSSSLFHHASPFLQISPASPIYHIPPFTFFNFSSHTPPSIPPHTPPTSSHAVLLLLHIPHCPPCLLHLLYAFSTHHSYLLVFLFCWCYSPHLLSFSSVPFPHPLPLTFSPLLKGRDLGIGAYGSFLLYFSGIKLCFSCGRISHYNLWHSVSESVY